MASRRRQIITGLVVLALVQGLAIALYVARKGGDAVERPFAVEQLSPRPAPPLIAQRSDGARVVLDELRGKTVMVHFWATWCQPCRDELPGLLSRARELSATRRFELIAVAVEDDWDAIRRFFRGTIPASIVRPEIADVHRRFGTSTLPDTYLVDAAGMLVVRYAGARDWSQRPAGAELARAIETFGGGR